VARRQPKARDTRERLLAAGIEAFGDKGYAATCVDDIADRAGTTRGAFYYYFSSKEDMAKDLQQDLWHGIAKRAQTVFDPQLDTITNMKRAFGAHLAALGDLGHARYFLREGFLDPTLEASGRHELEWGLGLVRDVLAEAMDKGEIGRLDPAALAGILTGLFEVATFQALEQNEATPTIDVVHALLDGLVPA
jgi:AcrR family transcriptional regulator